MKNQFDRKLWASPVLTVHGTVEAVTLGGKIKAFGGSDGFVLQIDSSTQVPIHTLGS